MIPAKKSLGQNFLKSKEALRVLIEAGSVTSNDIILEVGPGKGVLTEELLKIAKKVVAIEKDDRLIELLSEKFKSEIETGKFQLIHQDVLEFNPDSLKTERESYKIIANIPYYITGTFIQKFLEADFQPSKMVLMVQKEVALRIAAKDAKESILSMSVKAYGTPKYVMTVKAKYFSPAPKVDSAIILIDTISRNFFAPHPQPISITGDGQASSPDKERLGEVGSFSEEQFFKVMKAGFAHKRKMLIGNLSEHYPREKLVELFANLGINEKARAEDLTLEDFRNLTKALT